MADLNNEHILAALKHPVSISELRAVLDNQLTTSALRRRLKSLRDAGQVLITGSKRGTKYQLAELTGPTFYKRGLVELYIPNQTSYLSKTQRQRLHTIGSTGADKAPAGTYARDILERLLIDLSWSSSRLEGNTYSILETQNLIQRGEVADGKDLLETQMVLNHKRALEFLVENAQDLRFRRSTVFSLHAFLMENLLANPRDLGAIRTRAVGISGSRYSPISDPHQLLELLERILATARMIEDPFEAGVFVFLHISYLQPFIDGNKRTSRLALNLRLIRDNCKPISFVEVDREEYLAAKLRWYELADAKPLIQILMAAYEISCTRYETVVETIEPDPFHLAHRDQILRVVREIIIGLIQDPEFYVEQAGRTVFDSIPDQIRFTAAVLSELAGLHEGNFVRLRIKPSEFERWESHHK